MSDVVDRQRLRDAVEAQQHGAPAEAERLWRAILQQAPGRPDGYLGLAVALGAQGRTAEAAAMIAPAERKKARDARYAARKARR